MPLFFLKSLREFFENNLKKENLSLFIFSGSVIVVSLLRYVTHSEFWSIYYSKFLFSSGSFQESLYSKFIFHLVLSWIHWLPIGNISHLLVAKLTFGIVAVGILLVTYKILRLKLAAMPSFFILLFLYLNPLVFWELPQAKADIVCLLTLLLAIYFGLTGKKFKVLFFILLSIFATPKSILFLPLCLGIFYSHETKNFVWKSNFNLWIARISIVALVFLYIFPSSLNTYKLAASYFFSLLQDGIEKGFFRANNSYFIQLFLIYIFPSIIIFHCLVRFFFKMTLIDNSKKVICYGLWFWSFLCITIYPLKHPYFLIVFFFLIALQYIISIDSLKVDDLIYKFEKTKYKNNFIFLLLIFPFAGAIHSSFYNIGIEQLKMISRIDSWIQYNKKINIADATGILPRANNVPEFIDYFDNVATDYFIKSLATKPPDIILMTTKVFYKYHLYSYFIQKNYVYVSRYVLLKRLELPDNEVILGKIISKRLKETYPIDPKVVSFRAHSRIDKNRPIKATCQETGVQKFDWTIEEVESCNKFAFMTMDLNNIKKTMEVYPVPFAADTEKIFDRLPEITNFKDFGTLDNFITAIQSLLHKD